MPSFSGFVKNGFRMIMSPYQSGLRYCFTRPFRRAEAACSRIHAYGRAVHVRSLWICFLSFLTGSAVSLFDSR